VRSFEIGTPRKILCDEIKENEVGRACSTYREGRCIHTELWCRERDHLEDLAVDGRIILKCIIRKRIDWREMD
jgi:hypothetical protein